MKTEDIKPGARLTAPMEIEVIGPVENGDPYYNPDGGFIRLQNYRGNLWWARLVDRPGNFVVVCADLVQPSP